MSLRQLSRRNTEEHLSDAFDDALAASSGPRVLSERQNSSFLNNELDDFFEGSLLETDSNQITKAMSTGGEDVRKTNGLNSPRGLNVTSDDAKGGIRRNDSVILETYLDDFYGSNFPSISEVEDEEAESNFFDDFQSEETGTNSEVLVYEYEGNLHTAKELLLPSSITQIETICNRSIALTSSGQLYAWGDNSMNCLCMDVYTQPNGAGAKTALSESLKNYELKLYTKILFEIFSTSGKEGEGRINYNGFADMLHSLYGADVGVDLLIKINSRNMEKYDQLCRAADVDEKIGLSFTQFFELHESLSAARIKSQLRDIVLKNKARVIEIIFALSDEDKDGFINLKEMQKLAARTNGHVPELAWSNMCHGVAADPIKGIRLENLLLLYNNLRHQATLHNDYILLQKFNYELNNPLPNFNSEKFHPLNTNRNQKTQELTMRKPREGEKRVLFVPKPELIESLSAVRITQVSCGYDHTAVLTTTNVVLTFGSNEFGQLAHGAQKVKRQRKKNLKKETPELDIDFIPEDDIVDEDSSCSIHGPYKVVIQAHAGQPVQIRCGAFFTVLLTNLGQVWSAGKFNGGALGLGMATKSNRFEMEHILGLTMYAVVDIDVGRNHVIVNTLENGCFAWGSNSHGQLGLGEDHSLLEMQCKSSPSLLREFNEEMQQRSDKVEAVCAGSFHTCFITHFGNLYGCGSNIYSQLSFTKAKRLQQCFKTPTKLHINSVREARSTTELPNFGIHSLRNGTSNVKYTHVACNDRETMVATDSGIVYCTGSSTMSRKDTSNVAAIAAGGTKKYVICHSSSSSSATSLMHVFSAERETQQSSMPKKAARRSSSMLPKRTLVKALDLKYLRIVAQNCIKSRNYEPAVQQMLELFSNPAALNICFNRLSYKQDKLQGFFNFDAIQELYATYANNIDVQNSIYNATHNGLLRIEAVITNSRALPELRCLIILLLNPLYLDRKVGSKWANQYLKICQLFTKMEDGALQILAESFIRCVPREVVEKQVIKQMVWLFCNEMKLQGRNAVLHNGVALGLVNFLSRLHKAKALANSEADIIDDSLFYTDFTANLSLEYFAKDYWSWVTDEQGHGSTFTFCQYSFLLDPSVKRRILYIESNLRMQDAMRNAVVRSMRYRQPETKFLCIQIRRSHILEDSISIAGKLRDEDLRKPLKIIFHQEEGVDAGGVKREYFSLLVEKLFDPNFGYWKVIGDENCFWFTQLDTSHESKTSDGKDVYYLVGLLAGLAVYNNVILDLHFPKVLYKKLLGIESFTLRDLKSVDKFLYSGLKQLQEYDGDDVEDIFCLDFEVSYKNSLGVELKQALVEDGANKPVTSKNKNAYISKYLQFILMDSIDGAFSHFADGFLKVVDGKALHLFTPDELEGLVEGEKELDFDELKCHAEYEGGFDKDNDYVVNFWSIITNFDFEQKKKFLRFCTGADRAPVGGLKQLEPKFKLQRNGPDTESLPTSATCFNTLLLPEYESESKLRSKLLIAIENASGFGLQ